MTEPKNILIRLPNWLGDMVMSTAFVTAVKEQYPGSVIALIARKGLDFLLDYFPEHEQRYIFSKDEYNGLNGAWKFGKEIRKKKKYDLFFCLPDSFSSAIMASATGATERIGFKNEVRSLLLTSSFAKKDRIHRVEQYLDLLEQYYGGKLFNPGVHLNHSPGFIKPAVLININSEAQSRRLPASKAISLINAISAKIPNELILLGSEREKIFVDEVYDSLKDKKRITNASGKTNLRELTELIGSCEVMLSTDSGPAHIANALGTHCIVLFGAGNESNTAPYNEKDRTIIRLGELQCEPCTKNTCRLYDQPECLVLLDESFIVLKVKEHLNKSLAKIDTP